MINHSQFIGSIPKTLTIEPNSDRTVLVNTLGNSQITLEQGANLTLIAFLDKGWEEKQVVNFNFQGQNSTVTFIALIIGKETEKFPFETISNHQIPHTKGYYFIRSAMFDRSQVDYKGNLIIKPAAQLTDSYLSHHTLMLSSNAKTNTTPCLEIEADDVKAGHAATIGEVDNELLFYLSSRGLDKKSAQSLLIKGFLAADLKKIPSEEMQILLTREIENSLANYINIA